MPKPPKKPLTQRQQQQKKTERNFKAFVKRHHDLSANEAIRQWRGKGKKIGNVKGKDIFRSSRGITEKNVSKQRATSQRVTMYGLKRNPSHIKALLKDKRYLYVVQFEVFREGFESPEIEFLNLVSDRKLNRREVEDGILQYIEDMKTKTEKYKTLGLVDGSIQVIYGIDKNKK